MPNSAMTYTPDIVIDEATGQERIDYENGTVTTSETRRQIMDEVQREAQDSFYTDENGELHSDIDTTEQDGQNLIEMVGGNELYSNALKWAAENMDDEDIQAYDEAIETANPAEALELMQALIGDYQEDIEEVSEAEDFHAYFFNEVISEENFEQVKAYMQANADPEFIEQTREFYENEDFENFLRNIQRVIGAMMND